MNFMKFVNKVLEVKGNLLKVSFSVNGKTFETFIPDDEQWGAVKDILINREYEYLPEFELYNFKGGTVIDAGAHVGLFSLVVSNFADKVISIEAHPINYKLLEINIIKNNIKNVIPLNRALVGVKRSVRICEGVHSGGHSILGSGEGHIVKPITLEEIVKEYGKVDLLKIDVEGAEFEIFENSGIEVLRKIDKIVGEIHLSLGDFKRLKEILEEAGFSVKAFHPPLVKNYTGNVRISANNFRKLRLVRYCVYTLSRAFNLKDKSLLILFAWRGRK